MEKSREKVCWDTIFERAKRVSVIPPKRERAGTSLMLVVDFLSSFQEGEIRTFGTIERKRVAGLYYQLMKYKSQLHPRSFLVVRRGATIFVKREPDVLDH